MRVRSGARASQLRHGLAVVLWRGQEEGYAHATQGPRRPRQATVAVAGRLSRSRGESGQALLLMVGAMLAVLVGAVVLGGVARGVAAQGDGQRAADLAALAGARAMREDYPRLFGPALLPDDRPNPQHLERGAYLARARATAEQTGRRNGARAVAASFPAADPMAPVRIRVTVGDRLRVGERQSLALTVRAEAELVPPGGAAPGGAGVAGEYPGPFAMRQGKPMRPDVARTFDRLFAAARADGVALVVTSAFRSDAEQARLFAARPDPRWVARPGTSLHRLGTELDLGPASAYAWLARNAQRFGLIQRYAWEPWHYEACSRYICAQRDPT